MKKLIYLFLLLITACTHIELQHKPDGTPYKIAVIHSFDSLESCYQQYDSSLCQNFRKHGLDVQIWNFYQNSAKAAYAPNPVCHAFVDSAARGKYDLIISEGNTGLYSLMYEAGKNPDCPPIICGGVNTPLWDTIQHAPVVSVWTYEPEFRRTLLMANDLTGINMTCVELDYGIVDDQLREQLHADLTSPLFVDDIELKTYAPFKWKKQHEMYKDSLIVFGVSMYHYELNYTKDWADYFDVCDPEAMTRKILYRTNEYTQLLVKNSLYAKQVIMKADRPQFTVVPYEFGDVYHRFLGGYIVPSADEARDVAGTAVRYLTIGRESIEYVYAHQPRAVVDYMALPEWGLKYDDVKDKYEVWNVPNIVLHPMQNILHYSFLLFIGVLCVLSACYLIFRVREQMLQKRYRNIVPLDHSFVGHASFVIQMSSTDHILKFSYLDPSKRLSSEESLTLDEFHERVLPEKEEEFQQFQEDVQIPGFHQIDLTTTNNQGRTFHRWRFRFEVQRTFANILLMSGVCIQIDEYLEYQRKCQEAASEAALMHTKERFLQNLNHEIRTPLNSILGFSQILSRGEAPLSADEKAEICSLIRLHTNQLLGFVQDILYYSRIESGRMRYDLKPMDMEEIYESLSGEWQAKWDNGEVIDQNLVNKAQAIKLVVQQSTDKYTVNVDADCLHVVFNHLMENALKFTDSGFIYVGWYPLLHSHEICIYVRDTGMGMDDEVQKFIFREFWKSDDFSRGGGLGLSLAQSMANAMNGHVEVDSSPGRGTCMILKLPIYDK